MSKYDILRTLSKEGLILPLEMSKISKGGFEMGFKGSIGNQREEGQERAIKRFHRSSS